MWRKCLFPTLVAGVLLNVLQPAVANTTVDEQVSWSRPAWDTQLIQTWGMYANDTSMPGGYLSELVGVDATEANRNALIESVYFCKSMQDPGCMSADFVRYKAIIPMCDADTTLDCIQNITATTAAGNALQVTMQGTFGTVSEPIQGDPKLHLPTASTAHLFTIDGVTHTKGSLFAAIVAMRGDKLKAEATFKLQEFRAQIYAVRVVEGRYDISSVNKNSNEYRGQPLLFGSSGGGTASCIMTTSTQCLMPYALPLDVSLGITMNFSGPISGWMHGRIRDAATSISLQPDGSQRIAVSATPVQEPAYSAFVIASESHPEILKFYTELPATQRYGVGMGCVPGVAPPCSIQDRWSYTRVVHPNTWIMDEFVMWLTHVSDKAAALPSVWLIASTDNSSNRCYGDASLSGIVATNATAYLGGPPTFNSATQTLDYRIAAPHYAPDGTTAIHGTYDLLIRSDVARCLYGFGSAPVRATVSVLAEDGAEQTTAVTTVSEKDGWIHLATSGFTFSTPTVRVKLTQEPAPAAVIPTPTTAGTSSKAKHTITCVKGKVTKKVSGTNPKCPAGLKKR